MIQVYYGDGKGKTTAALGLAIRAKGFGQKVAIIFFDKGGDNYNERKVLDQLGIAYFSFGRDRRSSDGRFDFSLKNEDLVMAKSSMTKLVAIGQDYDLIVLDEVLNAVRLKMLPLEEILDYLDHVMPQSLELILTGRGLWPEIAQRADLITEMRMVKHYFEQKKPARAGIEF